MAIILHVLIMQFIIILHCWGGCPKTVDDDKAVAI